MITVSHYGIHWDESVAYLVQGRGSTNAIGSKKKSPFEVRLQSKRRNCNHQINLASPIPSDLHWDFMMQLMSDQLARAMAPIPKLDGGVYYIEETPALLPNLTSLSLMTSPIHPVVMPMWSIDNPQVVVSELSTTNLQPLIFTGAIPAHTRLLSDICRAAPIHPRKLIITGSRDVIVPPSCKRIVTDLSNPEIINPDDVASIQWDSVGSTIVRKFMRGEFKLPNTDERTRWTTS